MEYVVAVDILKWARLELGLMIIREMEATNRISGVRLSRMEYMECRFSLKRESSEDAVELGSKEFPKSECFKYFGLVDQDQIQRLQQLRYSVSRSGLKGKIYQNTTIRPA